jgi:hypothetical protein
VGGDPEKVGGDPENADAAGGVLDDEECVQPMAAAGVDGRDRAAEMARTVTGGPYGGGG